MYFAIQNNNESCLIWAASEEIHCRLAVQRIIAGVHYHVTFLEYQIKLHENEIFFDLTFLFQTNCQHTLQRWASQNSSERNVIQLVMTNIHSHLPSLVKTLFLVSSLLFLTNQVSGIQYQILLYIM